MLKSLLPLAGLALLAACASTPRPGEAVASARPNSACIPDASRIQPTKDPMCAFGASYSQQDLQRTGTADPGQALRILDPSISIHGH